MSQCAHSNSPRAITILACDPMDAQRRIATLHQHLAPAAEDAAGVHINPTAAEPELEYSVALPERLTPSGPWLVHRCACKPVIRGLQLGLCVAAPHGACAALAGTRVSRTGW